MITSRHQPVKRNDTPGIIKFGKAPAKLDNRNLKLSAVLRAPIPLPAEYDFDVTHNGIPTPMFGNDQYGDCVMAGRAHQTLRFETAEQGVLISITDKDVLREYLKETGGEDSGLVVLDSLKLWRKRGWSAAKQRFKIKGFRAGNSDESPGGQARRLHGRRRWTRLHLAEFRDHPVSRWETVGCDQRAGLATESEKRTLRLCAGLHEKGAGLRHLGPQTADDLGLSQQIQRRGLRHYRRR